MSRRGALAAAAALVLAGCGLDIRSADLFLLTRTGQGHRLTLLISDGGTIRCNGGAARSLPDPLLLQARDLTGSLNADAKARLRIAPSPHAVYHYTVHLQNGTVSFPDTAGAHHPTLARTELFVLRALPACG